MNKIKKDDLVVVIAGKDKDKQGKVISVDTKKNKVLVQGCNMVTKHTKQAPGNPQGGITGGGSNVQNLQFRGAAAGKINTPTSFSGTAAGVAKQGALPTPE